MHVLPYRYHQQQYLVKMPAQNLMLDGVRLLKKKEKYVTLVFCHLFDCEVPILTGACGE